MSITPIELDVQISLSRAQSLTPTDMTLQCFNTPNVDFLHGERVRFFSDSDSFNEITTSGSSVYWAGNAFFGLTSHPAQIAVGRIFTDNQPAYLLSASVNYAALASVSNGAFSVAIDGVRQELSPTDFSGVTNLQTLIAALTPSASANFIVEEYNGNLILKSKTNGANSSIGYAAAPTVTEIETPAVLTGGTVTPASLTSISDGAFKISVNGDEKDITGLDFQSADDISGIVTVLTGKIDGVTVTANEESLILTTTETGSAATLAFASAGSAGTDVSALLGLTSGAGASVVNGATTPVVDISEMLGLTQESGASLQASGYVAGSITEELAANRAYIQNIGSNAYAWSLDAEYRDTQDAQDFASWVNGLGVEGVTCIVTNNPNVLSASDTSNIAYICNSMNYQGVATFYHDNAQVYPDVAYLATLQSVNYATANSVLDMKFKNLGSIPAVTLPDLNTNLTTLDNKRCNTITYWGTRDALCVRNGDQSSSLWRSDLWVNVCNFIAELKINVANVFLRNKKIPYTVAGQTLLTSAITQTCDAYVTNGSFADREYADSTSENGVSLQSAYTITPQPISSSTAAQRRAGIGTPFAIVLNDSGSMRSVAISVEVVD
jgi:hypothetical protein